MATERLNSNISKAQQSDHKAIAELLNAALMPIGITVCITGSKDCLTIFANGKALPSKESLMGVVERGFADLEIDSIARVKIYGKSALNPEDSWLDEIVFFDELPNLATASKMLIGEAFKKLVKILSGASTYSRELLANKRVVYGVIGLAVAGLAVSGGLTGYKLVQARSAYASSVNEAQALVSEATASKEDGIEQLDAKLTQLKKARQLLRGVPESQSSAYRSAQKELGLVSQKIEDIEVTLSEVELVAGKLSDITSAVTQALTAVDQPPYAIEDWNKAKRELVSGITKLESIPQYGPLAGKIQDQIKDYQSKVAWIDQAIKNEQAGVDILAKAQQLAQDAYNFTNGRSTFEVADLTKARDMWTKALEQVKIVPPTTNAYRSVSNNIDVYTKNYNSILDGMYEINSCTAEYSSSDSMIDYCRSVYLYLTEPDS